MVTIKSINKQVRLLTLGSDQDPSWEYSIFFGDETEEQLFELAQNIYAKYGPNKEANLPTIDNYIGERVPEIQSLTEEKDVKKS